MGYKATNCPTQINFGQMKWKNRTNGSVFFNLRLFDLFILLIVIFFIRKYLINKCFIQT